MSLSDRLQISAHFACKGWGTLDAKENLLICFILKKVYKSIELVNFRFIGKCKNLKVARDSFECGPGTFSE